MYYFIKLLYKNLGVRHMKKDANYSEEVVRDKLMRLNKAYMIILCACILNAKALVTEFGLPYVVTQIFSIFLLLGSLVAVANLDMHLKDFKAVWKHCCFIIVWIFELVLFFFII